MVTKSLLSDVWVDDILHYFLDFNYISLFLHVRHEKSIKIKDKSFEDVNLNQYDIYKDLFYLLVLGSNSWTCKLFGYNKLAREVLFFFLKWYDKAW